MGRPFLVEVDNISSNKLYISQVCGTSYARNTDDQYWKPLCDMLEEFVWFSFLVKVYAIVLPISSNVVDSGIIHEARNRTIKSIGRNSIASLATNRSELSLWTVTPQTPIEFYVLDSNKMLVEWLDLPQPPGESIQ